MIQVPVEPRSEVDALFATRSSSKKFHATAVHRRDIEALLAAAVRAPDHGLLAPWRFAVMLDDARVIFADALEASLRARLPASDDETVARERSKAWRSPALIAVAVVTEPHPKVPPIEQVLAVGAAIENLLLAAHARGLGTMWKTGGAAYDAGVKAALGFAATDQIAGFIHVGVPAERKAVRAVGFEMVTRWL